MLLHANKHVIMKEKEEKGKCAIQEFLWGTRDESFRELEGDLSKTIRC